MAMLAHLKDEVSSEDCERWRFKATAGCQDNIEGSNQGASSVRNALVRASVPKGVELGPLQEMASFYRSTGVCS